MKLSLIQILISLSALSSASSALADTIPPGELRHHRLGGVVVNPETHEELFLSCVEKNSSATCIQYRFVAQIGNAVRVLGNQEVEPFKLSASNPFPKAPVYGPSRPAFPASKRLYGWLGEKFGPHGTEDPGLLFMPIAGIPGVLGVAIVGAPIYDTGRLIVYTPVAALQAAMKNGKLKKLRHAFRNLFDGTKSATSEQVAVKASQFEELKTLLVQMSTATVTQ